MRLITMLRTSFQLEELSKLFETRSELEDHDLLTTHAYRFGMNFAGPIVGNMTEAYQNAATYVGTLLLQPRA